MENKLIEHLRQLYENDSKHSHYQIMPTFLQKELGKMANPKINRYESQRFDFIKKHVHFTNKSVLDIGGNTGFFSFESLNQGAKSVKLIEGNSKHCDFVKEVNSVLGYDITVENRYVDFENENERADVTFLLNVLHHVGDDYGNNIKNIELAKDDILKTLNSLALNTKELVFQLGYCWKGNRNYLLFENGTKSEMIDFISNGTKDHWSMRVIGIPEQKDENITYNQPNNANLERNDQFGEFLNRPLFILQRL